MWRVTVRSGPKVEKHQAGGWEEAVELALREARVLANGPRRRTVDLRVRTFAPEQQVAGRVEVSGPGVRAGIDVRGDGEAEAWSGRIRRRVLEPEERETPYDALRRYVAAEATA